MIDRFKHLKAFETVYFFATGYRYHNSLVNGHVESTDKILRCWYHYNIAIMKV